MIAHTAVMALALLLLPTAQGGDRPSFAAEAKLDRRKAPTLPDRSLLGVNGGE